MHCKESTKRRLLLGNKDKMPLSPFLSKMKSFPLSIVLAWEQNNFFELFSRMCEFFARPKIKILSAQK